MEVPSFLSPFVDGYSPKRLFQGLAVGVIGTLIIGFGTRLHPALSTTAPCQPYEAFLAQTGWNVVPQTKNWDGITAARQ